MIVNVGTLPKKYPDTCILDKYMLYLGVHAYYRAISLRNLNPPQHRSLSFERVHMSIYSKKKTYKLCSPTENEKKLSSNRSYDIRSGFVISAEVKKEGDSFQASITSKTESNACGISLKPLQANRERFRIIDGEETPNCALPWNAFVRSEDLIKSYMCTGVIVGEYWVLTAAHCFPNRLPKLKVLVGTNHKNDGSGIWHDVEAAIPHQLYTHHTRGYDVALLRTETAIVYNDCTRPVCIAKPTPDFGRECVASGWGYTDRGRQWGTAAMSWSRWKVLLEWNFQFQDYIGVWAVPVTFHSGCSICGLDQYNDSHLQEHITAETTTFCCESFEFLFFSVDDFLAAVRLVTGICVKAM
ncbi:unnamed protein product [Soboliphyme baturini]|uniref:Peptidase S1 domain-containing protein n=1 Tax=Soboliphyme baturini TaxID=241478 RepID=A0A183IEK5_9BILA|nr:unnamed protein product [Soboliphyme baturini]